MAKSRQARKHGKQTGKATRIRRMEDRIAKRKTSPLSSVPDNSELQSTPKAKAVITVDSREPKELIDMLKETADVEVVVEDISKKWEEIKEEVAKQVKPDTAPISAARRAFQNK